MMGKGIKIVVGVVTALDNRLTQVKEGVKGSKDQREVKRAKLPGWVSWFNPSQQLSTTQPLAHSPPTPGMGERIRKKNLVS